MTLSYRAFEKVIDKDRIVSFWNNNGTIGISQVLNGYKFSQKGCNHRYVCLKPLEIETLLKKNEFHYEGIRPGLFPTDEKIDAYIINNYVEIKVSICSRFNLPDLECPSLSFPKTVLKELYTATKKMWRKKRETIRPLIGLNCKAGSFDALEGTLDQDKKNEEQRIITHNILKKGLS